MFMGKKNSPKKPDNSKKSNPSEANINSLPLPSKSKPERIKSAPKNERNEKGGNSPPFGTQDSPNEKKPKMSFEKKKVKEKEETKEGTGNSPKKNRFGLPIATIPKYTSIPEKIVNEDKPQRKFFTEIDSKNSNRQMKEDSFEEPFFNQNYPQIGKPNVLKSQGRYTDNLNPYKPDKNSSKNLSKSSDIFGSKQPYEQSPAKFAKEEDFQKNMLIEEDSNARSNQIQQIIQLNAEQSHVLQRQTDKIYEDFSNIVDIFGEAVSYQKSQFDPEFLQNVQEKLEMKIDNSGFLYQALSKEAAKDKTHSQILTENLADKKKEVLKMFTQLKPMLANFNLTEQANDFEFVLKGQPIAQRVYPLISFQNISQEKLIGISEALNQLLGKFFQIKEAGEKVVHNAQREKMLVSDINAKINEFSKKTNFLPANDIQYIINDLCRGPNRTNQIYLEKMIEERLINPEEVDTYHNQLGKVKRPDIVLTVEKLQQYKENFLL